MSRSTSASPSNPTRAMLASYDADSVEGSIIDDIVDPEFQVIDTKLLSLAVSHRDLGSVVEAHELAPHNCQSEIIKQSTHIAEITTNNIALTNRVRDLETEVSSLKSSNSVLVADLAQLQMERFKSRRTMVYRQLASSYQFRLATVLGHKSRPNRRFMLTHDVLWKYAQNSPQLLLVLNQVENLFGKYNVQPSDIEQEVNIVRSRGVETSHPDKLVDRVGDEHVPSGVDLFQMVEDMYQDGEIDEDGRNIANGLIDSILVLSAEQSVQALVGADLLRNAPPPLPPTPKVPVATGVI